MSEQLKMFLMLRRKNREKNEKNRQTYKQAEKNINFEFVDSISYNIIESMTKFKNSEIDKKKLNIELSINLSFILWKCNPKKKKKGLEDNDYPYNKKEKYPIKNFGIYIPTNRITFLEEAKLNIIKKYNKFTHIYENIKFLQNKKLEVFLPSSIIFSNMKYKKREDINKSINSNNNKKLINSSFISEESFMSNINNLNKSFECIDKENKIQKNFVKYEEIIDYIECPLIQKKSKKDKIKDFINLFNKIDDLSESEEIYQINPFKNNQGDNDNTNNNKTIVKVNFGNDKKLSYENNISLKGKNIKQEKNNVRKDINNNISGNMNESKNINKYSNINIIEVDKLKQISQSMQKKYSKKVNSNYIKLVHKIYMNLLKNFVEQNEKYSEIYKKYGIKTIFLMYLKQLLLEKDISNKIVFEKVYKNYIFTKKLISFDQFIQSLDAIILDKDFQNTQQKYLFLLNILTNQEFLGSDDIKSFFELIGCDCTYIEKFSENLGDKLIMRYNAVYKEEKNNIVEKKYRIKKMKIILESFFDQIQNYEI